MFTRIVPTNRLLVWVAIVLLPFGTVATALPDYSQIGLAVVLGFIAIVLLDLTLSLHKLDGITVSLPEVVRWVKNRPGALPVEIHNPNESPMRLRLGLPLPPQIHAGAGQQNGAPESEHGDAKVDWHLQLPAAAAQSHTEIRCTPLERGRYHLTRAHLETPSRLGLWGVRSVSPLRSELRVYPDLWSERRRMAAMFYSRGLFGRHAQRQVGKGRDFEKLREYVPGDSFDELHWKATARRGRPITKVFQIERTQEVYVIIDASRLSARLLPSNPPTAEVTADARTASPALPISDPAQAPQFPPATLERLITAALVLGLAAEQQGDLFGLLVYTDKIQSFIRANTGRAHFNSCRDTLFALTPQIVTPDFEELTTFIRLRLRRRALLVFLTALDDPLLAEGFVRNISLISRQHLILVNMLRPPGIEPFFGNRPPAGVNDLYSRLGGHFLWQHLRELEKTLQHRGVRLSLVDEERLTAQITTDYLRIKARQLL